MARLPKPGGDEDTWGDVLNDFLRVEHNSNGTLKSSASLSSKLQVRGTWQAGTAYRKNDVVQAQGTSFVCKAHHTSIADDAGFQEDENAGVWERLSVRAAWYDVRDYGARINGRADDTVAIQLAIDACSAAGGGTVFIPSGLASVTTLTLKNRVWLRGAGMAATTLRCRRNTNAPVVTNYVSPDGIRANAEFCAVMDMKIDGYRAGNSDPNSHCIFFTTNPLYTWATQDEWFDPHFLVQNVLLVHAAGSGYFATGRSEARLMNVYAEKCNSVGIKPSFDSYLEGCSAAANGGFGFQFTHGNIMANNCKAFNNGQKVLSRGAGFYVSGLGIALTMSGCIAQNNLAQGFYLEDVAGITMSGCVADSNNWGTGNEDELYTGVEIDNAQHCIIDLVATQGFQNGSLVGNQKSALRIKGGSVHNDIRLATYAQAGYTLGPPYTDDSILTGNRIVVDGEIVCPLPTLAASTDVTIINPAEGQILQYAADRGIWVNAENPATLEAASGGVLGDGSDGIATLDGEVEVSWAIRQDKTYRMVRDAYLTSLTVNPGVRLICTGFRIFCQGTMTNNGIITADGQDTLGMQAVSGSIGAGGSGGNGTISAGMPGSVGGCGVGAGGSGGNGAAGNGGPAVLPLTEQTWLIRSVYPLLAGVIYYAGGVQPITGGSGGSGGAGDGIYQGGSGGHGGGVVSIAAHSFINAENGLVSAVGAAGQIPRAGDCGGGGGGGGGAIYVFTYRTAVNKGIVTVAGGEGAQGVGSGEKGGDGNAGTVFFAEI